MLYSHSLIYYNCIKVGISENVFYLNDIGDFKIILLSVVDISNEEIEIKLNNKDNTFNLPLNKGTSKKIDNLYLLEFSVPINQITSEKSNIIINGEQLPIVEIKKYIESEITLKNIYGNIVYNSYKGHSFVYYEFEKEIPYSKIILNEQIEGNCYKLDNNKKIIYCDYSNYNIDEGKDLDV